MPLEKKTNYLIQKGTRRIYIRSEILADRGDMSVYTPTEDDLSGKALAPPVVAAPATAPVLDLGLSSPVKSKLIKAFGSLEAAYAANKEDLVAVKGVGEKTADTIVAAQD